MNIVFDFYSTLAEIYLIVSINTLLIFGVLLSTSRKWGFPLLNLDFLSLQVLVFTLLLVFNIPMVTFFNWSSLISSDFFSFGLKMIVIISALIWILLSISYVEYEKINSFEYWILILLAFLAILFILQSYDLLSMYLTIEFQSLIFYILASFKRTSEFSTEAGLKYFILGAFSSALLLFGLSILYSMTGLSNFNDFSKLFTGMLTENLIFTLGILISLAFITVAFLFKLSSAPFHMWSPDVYEGSPTITTAFFSIFPKLAIVSLSLRLFIFCFHDFFSFWKEWFLLSIIFSILIGSLGAVMQQKWKRFVAYSSITHVGFMLIGMLSGEYVGITNTLFYLVIYIFTIFGIFSFLIGLRTYKFPTHSQTRYLDNVCSLAKINPALSLSLSLILFSMAGIPPLAGFFAKAFVILTSLQNNFYGLALFSVFMSCVACFYYIRIVKNVYFSNIDKLIISYPMTRRNSLILSFSIILILFFFLDIDFFLSFLTRMALSFLN
uniref:NADH dehydrogenase subunit 2 n=1 Tax=Rhodogorgon sp. TaxID=2485824 RepID=A0A3G3MIR1_9FLOR|nr:NADH dehydrogenase subunit 2 [Rhodogorgon sp.]